ncbi:MAG: hypothetical protein KDA69_05720 [Planctomycetaceae bacterium]|nr:hypothetical protein [Planctomycetaceae bacterium]MCA9043797.1 hypothetical protein [Planctomycetaceae bacterium]
MTNHPAFNFVRKLDTKLAAELENQTQFAGQAEEHMRSLPARNLLRGKFIGLPTGQVVAAAIGVSPLSATEIKAGPHAAVIEAYGFETATPLR